MVAKSKHRVKYILGSRGNEPGHRLGVNALALDRGNDTDCGGTLYSAGRDGCVMSWDMGMLPQPVRDEELSNPFHTPEPVDNARQPSFRTAVQAHTQWVNDIVLTYDNKNVISASSDLTVKCWRPSSSESHPIGEHSDYVKCLATPRYQADWVASGGLDRSVILWDISGKGEIMRKCSMESERASIYTIGSGAKVLAYGGTEKVVRLMDQSSGELITKLIGHTDTVRSLLVSDDGRTIVTASSDATIKFWSLEACKCLYTVSCFDSVWSLHSQSPSLKTFYAGHRNGLVTRTNVSPTPSVEPVCQSVCRDPTGAGVIQIVGSGDRLWTATKSSEIFGWSDQVETPSFEAAESTTADPPKSKLGRARRDAETLKSGLISVPGLGMVISVSHGSSNSKPVDTIGGQHGLTQHILLSDRQHVLTMDTNGEAELWNIVLCKKVASYGKKDIDELEEKLNNPNSVLNWCTIDTRIGALTVTLDENRYLDGEVYADEMELDGNFRDDQRVNLGKWVMRSLFHNLIRAEQEKDEKYRENLTANEDSTKPEPNSVDNDTSHTVPEPPTPMAIDVATPKAGAPTKVLSNGQRMPALDEDNEYFPKVDESGGDGGDSADDTAPQPEDNTNEEEKDTTTKGSGFMSRLKSFSKGKRNKPTPVETKDSEADTKKKPVEPEPVEEPVKTAPEPPRTMRSVLERVRQGYDSPAAKSALALDEELPLIKFPDNMALIISEDVPHAGDSKDVYRGTVGSVGADVDVLEEVCPAWLGELLLLNSIPHREISKINFTMSPDSSTKTPNISDSGIARLNANKMLRVPKMLGYIAEKISQNYNVPDRAPSEWIDLQCNGQPVPMNMTLASIRAHIWRMPGDVGIIYKLSPDVELKARETSDSNSMHGSVEDNQDGK